MLFLYIVNLHHSFLPQEFNPVWVVRNKQILTPWRRVLLENLTVSQLVEKFPTLYGTRRFITVFTRARHWSLSWARDILSTPFPPCFSKIHSNIFFLSTDWWSLHVRYSDQSFVSVSHLSYACYVSRPSHPPFDYPNNIWWSVQVMKLITMQSSPFYRHLLPLSSKYSPQHPVLKYPTYKFYPYCEIPSFTPIQNNRKIVVLYILIYKCLEKRREDNSEDLCNIS
jgi:hypothetical protein